MDDMEARVGELEDLASIRRLKADYCFYADVWDGDDDRGRKFAELFTQDGTYILGDTHICTGRDQIEALLMELPGRMNLRIGLHLALNPRIDLAGDMATGTWHFLIPVLAGDDAGPRWNCGMYFEQYRRVDGRWLFQQVIVKSAIAPSP